MESGKLSAAQRAKIRRLTEPRELSPDEEGGELNIVPFLDIITNILIFVLATIAVTFTATIDTTPPASKSAGVRESVQSEALNLTVLIVNDGFSLKASGGNVAPGCRGVGAGISIPKTNGRYDYAALTACAAYLKGANPDFKDENQVYISANPGTDYQTVISAMDSLRATAAGDTLFDDVNFKVSQ
ncbi:MAG: biopolymer transporter ExbD [Sorangiineae bacterium]|nr:biopolymer transporter ExbD [Polyangiaceae bacterium]MEB2321399.1 biopolymer transporter ExbD [Sorangiineae bacterium]